MKTIKSIFFAILTACTTISIWSNNESIKLVDFNYMQHSQACINIHETILSMFTIPAIFHKSSLKSPAELCFVIIQNETPIGYIHCIIENKDGLRTLNIQEIAIDEKHQSKGYGTLLLETATDLAIKNQCSYISCTAVESAIPFYEKNGFLKEDYIPWLTICYMKKKMT